MIALKNVQEKERELIAASAAWAVPATFSGQIVLVDDGKQHDAEQLALREVGYVCTALFPMDATTISQGGTAAIIDAKCGLWIAWNPEKAASNIFDLIEAAKVALLGYSPDNPNDRFKIDPEPLLLNVMDEGLLAFNLFFSKRCAF